MTYSTQLTRNQSIALGTVAAISTAATSASKAIAAHARTFYANEVETGLLQADIARSIAVLQSCAVVAGFLLREAAIWCVFACLFTWHCWKEDSEQRAIAAMAAQDTESAQPTPASPQAALNACARGLAVFIVKAARFALWLEQSILTAYFSYLAQWARAQRGVRNFAR